MPKSRVRKHFGWRENEEEEEMYGLEEERGEKYPQGRKEGQKAFGDTGQGYSIVSQGCQECRGRDFQRGDSHYKDEAWFVREQLSHLKGTKEEGEGREWCERH